MRAEERLSPYGIRLFDPDRDFPALVQLINTIDVVDQAGELTTEAEQRAQLTWPGRDLLRDRCLVTVSDQDDQVVGFGDSWKMPTTSTADIYVAVHPAWRRRGFGGALLRRVLVRAGEQGTTHVAVYADAHHHAPHPFLRDHGFERAGAYIALHRLMPPTLETASWPAGYTLRSVKDVPDVSMLVELLNHSYGDRFGHKITTETDIQEWVEPLHSVNILLLFDAHKKAVGICRVRPASGALDTTAATIGYVDAPGVVPSHRQFNLYRSLVLAGVELLRQQGNTAVVIESWGDEERTISDYYDLGFTQQRCLVAYQRSVP